MTGLRSGEVARSAGVNLQTLRYYERRGLLAEPERTLGGHRMYPPETVTVLRAIKALQRLGFSLTEVAGLLGRGLAGAGRDPAARAPGGGLQAGARAKLASVEERIAALEAVAGTLRAALAVGCDDLVACAGEARCPLPFAGPPAVAPAVGDVLPSGVPPGGSPRSGSRA